MSAASFDSVFRTATGKALDAGVLKGVPVLNVDFTGLGLLDEIGRVSSLEAPHRIADAIVQSCERQGLPKPDLIDVDKTSWHRGAPRSRPGPDGMPGLPGKEGSAPRQQVHVLIHFPSEVQGPLLLGAGRFRGYGLCKPLGDRT